MARKVKWARTAQDELVHVAEYVYRDPERRATRRVQASIFVFFVSRPRRGARRGAPLFLFSEAFSLR